MRVFKTLKSDFRRLFQSPRFWTSWAAVVLFVWVNVLPEARSADYEVSLYYLVNGRGGMGAFFDALITISVFPFALSYREDVKNNYIHGLKIRSGGTALGWSHVIATAAGAFLIVFLGYVVGFGIFAVRCPLLMEYEREALAQSVSVIGEAGQYTAFIAAGDPILYFTSTFATEAMGYAFMAVFALMISAKIKNAFLVMSAPLALYYGSTLICLLAKLPGIFRWYYIQSHGGYFASTCANPTQTVVLSLVYFVCLICIEGLVFTAWTGKED